MPRYEFKVVPAPEQGKKAKGLKGSKDRFAHALESLMNDLGALGWDYVRADTLPCQERTGLTGKTTTYQNMLVFRRELAEADLPEARPAPVAGLLSAPDPSATLPPTAPALTARRDTETAAANAAKALSAFRNTKRNEDLAAE